MQNLHEDSAAGIATAPQQLLRSTQKNLAGIRKESTFELENSRGG